jgi:hypothetical protein
MTQAEVRVLVSGTARGAVLALDEPLSFWGGVDPETGIIIDTRHPQRGSSVAHRIVVMPGGRGSSSSSSVLAELMRVDVAPAGLVLGTDDPILAIGALTGEALYQRSLPVFWVSASLYARCRAARSLSLSEPGGVGFDAEG